MTNQLSEKILKLKKEKNAIILAHLYQIPEVQEIADYVGDSYYLSQVARDAKEDLIIFCGVKFMAESAKVLSPDKTVILPAPNAGCPMALNIMNNIPNKQILFLPDQNLGGYIAEFFPEKEFILWRGFCPTHHRITAEDVLNAKQEHPNVKVLAHPECSKEVRELSDYLGSTSGIIDYATKCEDNEFIIATEEGVLHQLQKKNPNKKFYFPEMMVCPNMKKTTLQDIYDALDGKREEVVLDEEIRQKALTSLENMHKLGN